MNELVTITRPRSVGSISGNVVVPAAIAGAGEHATRRFLEFFAATIRNRNTRMAYYRAGCSFFAWLDLNGITELADIEPIHVAAYIEALQSTNAKPTVKQHLAAVRMLFDYLVLGQILAINPAHAVRGPKHVVKRGKTPVLVADDARRLLDSIPTTRMVKQPDGSQAETPCLVGLRDRALIAVMTFALARIGAVVGMRVEDYYPQGKRWWLRLHEKGGKRHEMPAHNKLETYLDEYLLAAGIRGDDKGPLFRSSVRRGDALTASPMHRIDAYRMVRRRTADAGFTQKLGCHVFRATGITAYLEGGGSLENAQAMAAHQSPRTTKLYDRTSDAITLDEVERIKI